MALDAASFHDTSAARARISVEGGMACGFESCTDLGSGLCHWSQQLNHTLGETVTERMVTQLERRPVENGHTARAEVMQQPNSKFHGVSHSYVENFQPS